VNILVVASNPCSNGDHRDLTATIDGVVTTLRLHNDQLAEPLTADEREAFLTVACKIIRRSGTTIHEITGRVLRGEETNVKQYDLIGAGSAITKTNIGVSYVDVLPGANGQRALVDFTGCTEFRLILNANLVGTGPWAARVVRDSDNAVLYEAPALGAAGERELDTDWLPLPGAASGLALVRLQARSQVGADDPVFRRCVLVVR
jgi:hypothetical protein